MNDTLVRLERIFREILDDPNLELSAGFSPSDHGAWDSVATVQIVLAVEQEFSCRLPTEVVGSVRNAGDILRHLAIDVPAAAFEGEAEADPKETSGGKDGMDEGGTVREQAEALLVRARLWRDSDRTEEAFGDLRLAVQLHGDFNFLTQAAQILDGLARKGGVPLKARPIKIALLSSSTTELVVPLIRLACFRDGLWAKIHVAPFDNFRQEILDPGSALYRFAPDFVIIALNWRDAHVEDFSENPKVKVQSTVTEVAELGRILLERTRCTVIQHNFDLPAFESTGHLGAVEPRGRTRLLRAINASLEDSAPQGVIVLDFDRVSSQFGKEAWESPELWHSARQHPASQALPLLVDHYLALMRARLGLVKKVLVLDLDNTLWGGVIGEDGVEGIQIGPPSPVGEAHAALQAYVKALSRRGILLAVCSKNNEADARLPFRSHEGMILKKEDFVAFVANWDDKPSSLRAIAAQLNLGLDSFVFLDDNPVERAQVRRALPEVAVVEPGTDPAGFVRALHQGLYFEAMAVSTEDGLRSENYRANLLREEMKAEAPNLDSFLRQLDMRVYHGSFSDHVFDRVVQLLGKTNQFNLTTRRHSAETVRAWSGDGQGWTRYFRLVDRYGDNGIVGLIIARPNGPDEWEIDTFLMSCRVIGRQLENFMILTLLKAAGDAGRMRVRGHYFPTAKNSLVADFYPRLGFVEEGSGIAEGAKSYVWNVVTQALPEVLLINEVPSRSDE